MKKNLLVISFVLFQLVIFFSNALAAEVTLAWNASGGDPDGYRIHYGTSPGSYSQTIDVGNLTEYTVSGLQSDVTYYFVTSAYNEFGASGYSNQVSWTYSVSDTQAPSVSINGPASTTSPSVNISGTANDNVGVTEVTWDCNTGGQGTAQGTSNWQINNISLREGQNIITVSAADAAGNIGTAQITITYTLPPDNSPPQAPKGLHIVE
jgi:hypothetical protein